MPVVIEFQEFLRGDDYGQDENEGDRRQGFLGITLEPVGGALVSGGPASLTIPGNFI